MKEKRSKIFFLLIITVTIISFAQPLIKKGMNSITINGLSSILNPQVILEIITNGYVISGIIIYGLALLLLLGIMTKEDISFIYPLLSLGYVLTAIFAIFFLNETVSMLRWIGIGFIFLGSYLIGRS
jgi:uncharacterized membrane protein